MTEFQIHLLSFFREGSVIFFQRETENILAGVNERNLCGRLSTYLEGLLKVYDLEEYFSDTEYNRKQNGEIKTILDDNMVVVKINCDLIIHSRGNEIGNDNLVAIEMKKSTRPEHEKTNDKNRLRALTKSSFDGVWSNDGVAHPDHVCGYQLGVYMELDVLNRRCLIEVFSEGESIFQQNPKF